uniref:PEP-CTERM protein-sorting domain-containing protein n=1 Tax=Solibacter usitatus (strain Ellin6076) TaxID=234267 RepID=Q01S60_SOLUE
MKKLVHAALCLNALTMLLAVASPAATITISDLTDGFPIITVSPDIGVTSTVFSDEQVIITGLIPNLILQPGTHSVILTEPASDPFGPPQSDFATLTIGAAAPTFTLLFESDGALNFLADLAKLPVPTPTLLENGNFQDVSALLGSGNFTILLQSDLVTPEPEPDVRFLFTSGLLLIGVALVRINKSSRSHR